MAITNEQCAYAYLAQGVPGTPYTLRATPTQNITFQPNPLLPALPETTLQVFNKSLATVIMSWATMTDYIQWIRDNNGIETVVYRPATHYNNIYTVSVTGDWQGDIIQFIARDNLGNEVARTGASPAGLVYDANSRDLGPDFTEYPLYLTVYADYEQGRCAFAFASEFSSQRNQDYPLTRSYYHANSTGSDNIGFLKLMLDESMLPDSEGGAPTGEPDGGGGFYDYPFGAIPEPQLPTISVCDTGMVSLWNTNASQMYQLANKLWNNNFFDNIIKNFASPMDNIISLHVVPFSVYGGTQANIHIGNYDTEIPSNMLTTSYFKLDCGIIELTGAYQTFADYAPFTDIQLYLPYIGIVPITPDDIIDGAINVKYNIDVFSGSCVAYIMIRKRGQWTCVNQYTGNISTAYPITSANYTNVYMGIAQSAFKALTAGALFGALGAGSVGLGAMGGMTPELSAIGAGTMAGSSLQGALTSRPTYQRSGGIGASAGLMGVQSPYLIISKPNFIQAQNFRETKGYVSNLSCVIGDESGYISASVNNEQLTDIDCTTLERDMIKKCLAEGVYI